MHREEGRPTAGWGQDRFTPAEPLFPVRTTQTRMDSRFRGNDVSCGNDVA